MTYQHQLHVSANAAVAIVRLDTVLSEKLNRYDITQNKQDNTCYMLGSLPSAHTPADFV